jgi:hypothetical protein
MNPGLSAAFWRLRGEIVRRGFALFGATEFNLPVNVGRKPGGDDRATEFRSRCRQLGINGVTLHSYR